MSLTDDFCETFATKEDCVGAMARFIPVALPQGVDSDDPRVRQIVRWCRENFPGSYARGNDDERS